MGLRGVTPCHRLLIVGRGMRLDRGFRGMVGRRHGLLLRVDSRAQLLGSWLADPPGGRPV